MHITVCNGGAAHVEQKLKTKVLEHEDTMGLVTAASRSSRRPAAPTLVLLSVHERILRVGVQRGKVAMVLGTSVELWTMDQCCPKCSKR